jgi:von Willebrand factor type A domain-containing protein
MALTSAAAPTGLSNTVLDLVILVDESGSMTDADIAQETNAAGTIVQSLLSPDSRVTVVGFGGVNNVAPGQDPVNIACQPTIASGAVNLSYLASCVNGLHQRTEAEGDDTDYAAALGQAMSYFNPDTAYGRESPAGANKVILMMTGSGVDVHRDTQQYGSNWLAGERSAVNEQLAIARQDDVQIWPLGFGNLSDPDQQYLQYLAENGAQSGCDTRSASRPHATIVGNAADALSALNALYAAAGCLGTSTSSADLGGGQTLTLSVTIPVVASNATISVAKENPNVQVSFFRPDGTRWTNGSVVSGTATAVETLYLTSPQPGQWQIRLQTPPGLVSQRVGASVFWQGAVDAVMTASPSSVQPGQSVNVALTVLSRNGPITDQATLADLKVTVTVSGNGLSGSVEVPVRMAAAQAGDYIGKFTVPQVQGTLTFTGTATGYGLYATTVPATVQVGGGALSFLGTVQLPLIGSVQAGKSIQGQVLFSNRAGTPRAVRLSLAVSHAFATITSPTGTITVPSGTSPATPFTITFAKNSPSGPAWLEVEAVDAVSGVVYGAGTLDLTVVDQPGILAKYYWEIVAALILALLGCLTVLFRQRARRRAADVRGLYAMISRDGERVGAELKAPGKSGKIFRFIIRDEDELTARLDYPRPEDSVYLARRGRVGQISVTTPEGEHYDIMAGDSGELLPSGLRLAFRDAKRATLAPQRMSNGIGPSAPSPVPQPADSGWGTVPSHSPPDDPWLT